MEMGIIPEDATGIALREDEFLLKDATIDPTAFIGLYNIYVRPIYRYIYTKVGEAKQAEDLTAQVFLEALESLPRYRHDGHFAAWLFSIARHKVTDYYRTRHEGIPIEAVRGETEKAEPLAGLIHEEEISRLSGYIHQLKEDDQELLRLRLVAELNFGEVARLTHCNMETAKKRYYRLITQLREQMEVEND